MPDTTPPRKFTSPSEAMRYAIELARQGVGHVEPNPPVGAVVVDASGKKVGEGWHQEFGGPHAEIHALNQAGEAARGGTLYVTLEPCCHHGKTPPCTNAVIASGVNHVLVAAQDPAPWVAGQGLNQLRKAGIDVQVGLEAELANELIEPFAKLVSRGLPWVHAKWAMSLDGKIATRDGQSQWISNSECRAIVHELRGRMDAIVIGVGTALQDNPLLTARPSGPRTPLRVVLDSHARLSLTSQLVRTAHQSPVLVCVSSSAPEGQRKALESKGIEMLVIDESSQTRLPTDTRTYVSLAKVIEELGRRQMTHVLIEGGSDVFGSAFDQRLVDEVHVFVAPIIVGGSEAVTPVGGLGLEQIGMALPLRHMIIREVDGNVYIHGRVNLVGSE